LVLDLALWGVADPSSLAFLDPPPKAALNEARTLLRELDAIDEAGRITDEGRKLRALPLPPRLARMIVDAAAEGAGLLAAEIALVVTERGLGGNDVDLRHRLDELRRDRGQRAEQARRMAKQWARDAGSDTQARMPGDTSDAGAILALAYPDRIAKNRGGDGGFLLANGRGASLDLASPLSREPFLAVAEISGSARAGRILLAAPISLDDIERRFAAHIVTADEITVDDDTLSLRGSRSEKLGALRLVSRVTPVEPNEANAKKLADGIARAGLSRLPWTKTLAQWRGRVAFLRHAHGDEPSNPWPDLSDEALTATVHDWLTPMLVGKISVKEISADDLGAALANLVTYALRQRLDAEAPTHFEAPTGSRVPIEYDAGEGPKISIRVQELFGLNRHPAVAGGRVPLVVELLSPAHRPVQITRDLPGFWRGSYAAVKSEMRGRYPRHPWPDDPTTAPATRRAKPRGT
jgi:ATP-dependent helicase HrpB